MAVLAIKNWDAIGSQAFTAGPSSQSTHHSRGLPVPHRQPLRQPEKRSALNKVRRIEGIIVDIHDISAWSLTNSKVGLL